MFETITKMENFDEKKWGKQPVNAPEDLYDQVRQRIIEERIRMAQNHRQLLMGSALLLVLGVANTWFILLKNNEKQPISKENAEKILYKTYFDNTLNLSNEK